MRPRIDINQGQVFNSLTILKEVDKIWAGKELRRAVEVKCVCGHIFTVRYSAVKTGSTTSCGCQKSRYVTPENRNIHLENIFDGTTISRLDSLEILNGHSKVNLKCECGHFWEKDFNTLASKKVSCPSCAGFLKRAQGFDYKEEVIVKLEGSCLSLAEDVFSKVGPADSLLLKCSINNCIFKRRVDTILYSNHKCPCQSIKGGFKQTIPAVLYLLELKDENNLTTSYKYGITNNFQQRLGQIKRKYPNSLDIFYTWEYEFGFTASYHEKIIKNSLLPIHNKISMPDGYTETFSKEMLCAFLAVQQSQYREVYHRF